ncbi:MAG: lysophospholipid acyltransferase family protein [Thermoanaerobaculia bacterium]
MTPLRFLWRCGRALVWFVAASVRVMRRAPATGVDHDLTHLYASTLSQGFKRIFRLRHEVRGAGRLSSHQPCVYLANHRSNLDVITMCEILPHRTVVIGKREMRKIPLLGRIFERGGNVPINRRDPDEARAAIEAAERKLRDERVSIFMFPEGTRNHGRLLPFKKGAFHLARNAGVPIVPLVCAVTPGWMRGGRLWLAPEVDVLIEVLQPVESGTDEVDALIEETRDRMADALARLEEEVARRGAERSQP